ncbi:MAG: hypothetical protein WKF86_04970 [Acidimicrobiales bacterium]
MRVAHHAEILDRKRSQALGQLPAGRGVDPLQQSPVALYVVLVDAPSQSDLSGWQRPWASALVQALLAITSLAAAAAVLRRPVRSTRLSPPG